MSQWNSFCVKNISNTKLFISDLNVIIRVGETVNLLNHYSKDQILGSKDLWESIRGNMRGVCLEVLSKKEALDVLL
jgi:hypothetical protein